MDVDIEDVPAGVPLCPVDAKQLLQAGIESAVKTRAQREFLEAKRREVERARLGYHAYVAKQRDEKVNAKKSAC